MALAVASLIERYRRLRSQPMWSLLAADTGSETIACLQVLLYDTDRRLAQSVFAERLLRLLNAGSLETVTLEAAQKRIVSWRDAGYVVRHLEEHDTEPYVSVRTSRTIVAVAVSYSFITTIVIEATTTKDAPRSS